MLELCGLPVSNYYSKVKLALLEKGVPFREVRVGTAGVGAHTEETLRESPLGKIPYIRTERGPLCESQAILEFVEASWPEPPLLPKDAYAAAKIRELAVFVDLHLELVVRDLYPKAFFGGSVSEANAARVRKLLERNIAAFRTLARFAPFVGGETFTQADCSAWSSLPLVARATQVVYGEDLLAAADVDWKGYLAALDARPSVQKVKADRKASTAPT